MLYFDKQCDGWRISIWHVTEALEELLAILPDDETVKTEATVRFHSSGRILEWVAVRVLLYTMLGRQVPIEYKENGAPLLPDYENLDISISHTRGYVAVALTERGGIGIDIEQKGPKVERVKQRFIRDDESAETLIKMLIHWSAKETAYKVLQRRKVDFLKHLRVSPFEENEEGVVTLHEMKTDDLQTMEIQYKVFPEFVLTYSLVP